MANEADDTPTADWPVFTSAIAFTARLAGATHEWAEEFLLTEVGGNRIQYRHGGHLDFGKGGRAFPESYFFLRTPDVHHEVAADSSVFRAGPAVVRAQPDSEFKPKHAGEKGWTIIKLKPAVREDGWVFDLNRRVTTRMPCVQLYAAAIVRRLREIGAMVPSANLAQQELPLPAPALAPQSPPPSTSAPSKVLQELPAERADRIEKWLNTKRDAYHHLHKDKAKWVKDVAYPEMRREFGEPAPWDSPESLRRAMYRRT
jgi:hypothetical protein